MSHGNGDHWGDSRHSQGSYRGGGRYFDQPPPAEHNRRDADEWRGSGSGGENYRNVNERAGNGNEWWNRDSRRGQGGHGRRNVTSKRRLNHLPKQYDETGVARKKVKGGRIAKVRKVREPEPDLFCEVCGYYLADANAKAGHDRGRLHLQKIEEKREQLDLEARKRAESKDEDEDDSKLKIVEYKDTLAMSGDRIFELYKRALDDKRKPATYTKWCLRSLKNCPGAENASGAELQEIQRPVQREIIEFTAHKYDDGTWLLQNWDSLPLATGRKYTENKPPKPYSEIVVPDTLVEKLYDAAPAFADVPVAPPVEQGDGAADMEVDISNEPEISVPHEDEVMAAEVLEEKQPLVKIDISWRMSRTAAAILKANQTTVPHSIVSLFVHKYPRDSVPKKAKEDEDSSREELVKEFRTLRTQFVKEDYDSSVTFDKEVNGLIEKMERAGNFSKHIQECCEMLVGNAINSFEFALLPRPLARLMTLYKSNSHLNQTGKEYVGYWVISLLMQAGKMCSKEPNISLECSLRELPARFMKLESVKFGLAVIRSLVTNNHSAFFSLYANSPVHLDTSKRSAYVMQAFIPIVRQRALLLWASPRPIVRACVFAHPSVIPLEYVLEKLNWSLEGVDGEEEQWDVEDAKEHMKALGLYVVPEGDGKTENLVGSQCAPLVKPIPYIDCATIFGFLSADALIRLK